MSRNRMVALAAGVLVLVIGLVLVPRWGGEKSPDSIPTAAGITSNQEILPTATAEVVVSPTQAEGDNPTQSSPVEPTPRAALDATDPAIVSLASGEIQLVEFFAYW